MATRRACASGTTTTAPTTEASGTSQPTVHLDLHDDEEKDAKAVKWTDDTIDNEGLGKKKSKCCCVYVKPQRFGESSSEEDDDDDCQHCRGHVEKKRKKKKQPDADADTDGAAPAGDGSTAAKV